MTDTFRAMCAELHAAFNTYAVDMKHHDLLERARALLDQPAAEGPKPVVDYSRVPEIATEAQIRSAAQYLIKKRNCDGDLIEAIEYAIARWGRPTPQPVAVSERLPEPDDCDEQGRCWVFDDQLGLPSWTLIRVQGGSLAPDMYWLPANALPTRGHQ